MNASKVILLDEDAISKKIYRIALEIAEEFHEAKDDIVLVGIAKNGTLIARAIQKELLQLLPAVAIEIVTIKLNKKIQQEVVADKNLNYNQKNIVLIDDVVNTGRTFFYALKHIQQADPNTLKTVALLDRSHKQFPIKTDFVGLPISTTLQEYIEVEVIDDKIKNAYLLNN
ncbi:MAG: phosphoribosyltransferase family protein [Phycisphaerales bacterium]|nr:phosphoribosyltransferase family protein [Phycisphaerales bacterium]